jgi:iron complex transport system substrate-binding protein
LSVQQGPQASSIVDMGFNDQGQVDLESVLAKQPDLMIAQLRGPAPCSASAAAHRRGTAPEYADFLTLPARPIGSALGKVLNREAEAKAYTDFYQQRWQRIQQGVAQVQHKADIFAAHRFHQCTPAVMTVSEATVIAVTGYRLDAQADGVYRADSR